MNVELLAYTKMVDGRGPEALLAHSGRVCYNSQGSNDAGFLQARIREGHESLIEHASFTFEISGISRSCSHQIVRHRLASYSQRSMRYVLHDQAGAVVPQTVMDNKAMSEYTMGVAAAQDVYEKLLEMGVPKEDARFVLPIGTMTRLVITMNCRSLRHLFKVRISKHAQWEIRDVAKEMLRQCLEVAPNAFGDFEELLDV